MNIEISEETYNQLSVHAEGFETPESVIKKLLDFFENTNLDNSHEENMTKVNTIVNSRQYTKYRFNNRIFGKGRLVLAVIQSYCSENQDISFNELEMHFPKHLQGSHGVFAPLHNAKLIADSTGHKRHFIKENEIISIKDGEIAVCTEWGAGNIDSLINTALSLGFEIEVQEK